MQGSKEPFAAVLHVDPGEAKRQGRMRVWVNEPSVPVAVGTRVRAFQLHPARHDRGVARDANPSKSWRSFRCLPPCWLLGAQP